ncbi:MFS family permease [Paraburkholderia youngii]
MKSGLSLLAYTLPTLIVPPFAERLALRFDARRVIPLGLFIIGLGFILMRCGAGVEQASWLTMLPGCLLSGIGLGMTNTPVTNTATGSVSSNRAGMASGIDMSARLISLAINIALMGYILFEGVLSYLSRALPGPSETSSLRFLAQKVAAGNFAHLTRDSAKLATADPHGVIAHAALVHGLGLVMLYAVICVWALALLSVVAFGLGTYAHRPNSALDECARRPST